MASILRVTPAGGDCLSVWNVCGLPQASRSDEFCERHRSVHLNQRNVILLFGLVVVGMTDKAGDWNVELGQLRFLQLQIEITKSDDGWPGAICVAAMRCCEHIQVAHQASCALIRNIAVKVGIANGCHMWELSSFRILAPDNQLSADIAVGDTYVLYRGGRRAERKRTERDFLVNVLSVLDTF